MNDRIIILAEIDKMLSDTKRYGVDPNYACTLVLLRMKIVKAMDSDISKKRRIILTRRTEGGIIMRMGLKK